MEGISIFWLIFAVALFILEGVTAQLVAVWMGIAALLAIIPAEMGADVPIQILLWVIVSLVLVLCTRPFVNKVLKTKKVSTNADSNIGKVGTVIVDIDLEGNGRIYVDGLDWAARSQDGSIIPAGNKVVVKSIEGVTLIVEELI